MAYPTEAEVKSYLEGTGLTLDEGQESALEGILAGVIAEWEKRTGWIYFITSSAGVVMRHSSDGSRFLPLDCGILTLGSVVVDGTTLTENTDFELWPYNRSPKKEIRFRSIPHCDPRGIVVTATWGYAASCPADVFLLIQQACGVALADQGSLSSNVEDGGDVARLKQGPVDIEYREMDAGAASMSACDRTPGFKAAVNRYRFRTL